MSLGERIAKFIAPEAVSLTTDYVARLRAAHDARKNRIEFLERENKRLLREVMKWKNKAKP